MGRAGTVLRQAGPPLLAAAMLLAASVTGRRAVLFPEAVALGYGVWTLRREAWARPVPLVAVPTACAVVGAACAWGPGPRWVWVAVALTIAVGLLQCVHSPLIPAVSAAVLPVVFGVRDLTYPLAVLAWCGVLALTVLPRPGPRRPTTWPAGRVVGFLAGAVVWILGVGVLGAPALAVAPPLLVAGLEFTVTGGTVWSWRAARRVLLMGVAGAVGALALASGGPAPVTGGLAVVVVMAFATVLAEPLTPAVALAVVPFVADVGDPLLVALAFLTGGAALTVLPAAAARLASGRSTASG
ncbi:hypothetical protein LQ327_23225 [Actinomycetospora endophytica]|uniref:Fusaric acid resistance family protein n=1 Tax=Actinomycetospora endophytica TaxID=2291215 RepID=A0ABS8PDF0_9PSEU|nr:hypothetical protein [Actinomycetospora endophytica]MCD2196291.1 hypothetical protein [Actinomycetospora endophytica]